MKNYWTEKRMTIYSELWGSGTTGGYCYVIAMFRPGGTGMKYWTLDGWGAYNNRQVWFNRSEAESVMEVLGTKSYV